MISLPAPGQTKPGDVKEDPVRTSLPGTDERHSMIDRPRLPRLSPARMGPRLLSYSAIGLVVVLGVVFGVRWLAMQNPAGAEHVEDLSLEAQWNKTIARLGIKPVFPPEEDLAVGDLFAAVVEEDQSDPAGVKDKVDATPF